MHLSILLVCFAATAFQEPSNTAPEKGGWKAPETAVSKVNPVPPSKESVLAGAAVYKATCVSCHGAAGHGDGPFARMLQTRPLDLSAVLPPQSDGEIFWKVRTGNAVMPSLAKTHTEESTWHLVNYLRTLATPALRTHPWASFPPGAWVDVHTHHSMTSGSGATPTEWDSDSRMTVVTIGPDSVLIRHENPKLSVAEDASLVVPAVDEFPGVRALGQWPHDIFPFGPERKAGVTPKDKQPAPQGLKTEHAREEALEVAGRSYTARVVQRAWKAAAGDATQDYVLAAWLVNGVELPIRCTLTVDGKVRSESEIVSFEESVKVGEVAIPCVVTLTKKHLPEGTIVKRQWSSTQVPGFLVKMESQMQTEAYSITVNEWVTGFRPTAVMVAKKPQDERNPPGSRPALGFMPDYESAATGVRVQEVAAGGPADEAGLLPGDRITAIGGEAVLSLEDYMEVISDLRIGRLVVVKLVRDGKERTLQVRVGQRS